MATTVPAEFLFLGQSDAPLLAAFMINGDGSLIPVAGSPFSISSPARSLAVIHGTLVVADEKGVMTYQVDGDTGVLQQTDAALSSMTAPDSVSSANQRPQRAVLDTTGRFMYVVDLEIAELRAFRVEHGTLIELETRYQLSPESDAAVIVSFPKKRDGFDRD